MIDRYRLWCLGVIALAACSTSVPAAAALTMQKVGVADVAPSGFSVLWRASEPCDPEIRVYADPAGATEVTSQLEIVAFPVHSGDPTLTDEVQKEASRDLIGSASRNLGLVKISVGGCAPATNYYYKVGSRTTTEFVAWPGTGLQVVKTTRENSFVADSRQVLLTLASGGAPVDGRGWLVTASNPEALAAISAYVGDGCAADQVYLNLAQLFGANEENWQPGASKRIDLEFRGPVSGDVERSVDVEFAATFNVGTLAAGSVDVYPINVRPSFTVGSDQTVDEDAGDWTVAGWATGITAGAGESGQILTFNVTNNDNPGLFASGPAIDPLTGNLTSTPAAEASGNATITLTLSDDGGVFNGGIDTSFSQSFRITVLSVNDAPTLAAIDALDLIEDDPLQTVNFAGVGTGAANEIQALSVTATSDNPALIPNPAVNYVPSGATGSLSFTPVANASGTAVITVTVSDEQAENGSVSRSFAVNVSAVNDPPTLAVISDIAIDEDAGLQTVALAGIGAGPLETQTLYVTATSDNPALIPNPAVNYVPSGAIGSLSFTPVANAFGTAVITVTVDDGQSVNKTFTRSFTVTVAPVNDAPTLDAITPDPLNLVEDATLQTVSIAGVGTGAANELQALNVMATSDNTALIPNPVVSHSGSAATGSLSFTPVANASGTAAITVTVSDGQAANGSVSRSFAVNVSAVNDAPTDIAIAGSSVPEHQPVNTTVGALSTVDVDSSAFTYTLESGLGDADNAQFQIAGGTLQTKASFDAATKSTYTVRVRSTDEGNLWTEKPFTITIINRTEPVCGTGGAGPFTAPPSIDLCSPGAASTVTTNAGTYTWSCANDGVVPDASCTATRAFIVTPNAGVGGTLDPGTPQTANYNQTRTFTASADLGYSLVLINACSVEVLNNADPGVVAKTFDAGPVLDTCSVTATFADRTIPTSSVLDPAGGANFMAPAYRIGGSAADTGSGLAKVEISINGGAWLLASGTASWSYDWVVPTADADPSYTIHSRATDKSGNVETPAAGVTVTVYRRAPSAFTLNNRQLLLDGNPFTIKGVVYSPVPIGIDPETTAPFGDYFTSGYGDIQDRDLTLLRAMGANAVQIPYWGNGADHREFLDRAYSGGLNGPIYVIAGFWIDPGLDLAATTVREQLKADFSQMVATHRNHPAILLWSIGSDLNATGMYGDDPASLFSLVEELAAAAHAIEGSAAHPVAVGLTDVDLIATIDAHDSEVPSLDLWGAAVRGTEYSTLFGEFQNSASNKPLVVLGFGVDAYDNTQGDEYENLGAPLQGDYAEALWGAIVANAGSCVGGTVMEYADEWWRGKQSAAAGCADAGPAEQSACGQADAAEPDGYLNEEWRGLVRVADNGDDPDLVEPREAYDALQFLWAPAGQKPVISEWPQTMASFGSMNIGQVSAAQTVTFTNSGTTDLVIGTISIAGTDTADFAKLSDFCSGRTLIPAASCTVGVVFTPKALNARSAELSVPSSDPTRGTVTMALQGTGIDTLPPSGTVTINGGSEATRSTAVTLTLTAVDVGGGAIQMCVSNTTRCSAWTAFTATKSWRLTAGNGTKVVRVWFRDARGNTTPTATPYTDTIIFDATAPVNGIVRATPGIGRIALTWAGFSDALSGIGSYKVVFAVGVAPASCAIGKVVPGYDGTTRNYMHTGLINVVYGYRVCAIDKAGNMSLGAIKSARPLPTEASRRWGR